MLRYGICRRLVGYGCVLLGMYTSNIQADTLYMGEIVSPWISLTRMDSLDPTGSFEYLRFATEPGWVHDIELDPAHNRMFWSADPPANVQTSAQIRTGDLNAQGMTIVPMTTTVGPIFSLASDPSLDQLFFATSASGIIGAQSGIMSVSMTGGAATMIMPFSSGSIYGLAADPVAQKLYVAMNVRDMSNVRDSRVIRMNYDGTGIETLYDLADSDSLADLEIDVARDRLVFARNGDISVGTLDGSQPLQVINTVRSPLGIALSNDGNSIFFSDISNDSIHSINFDGSSETFLNTVFNVGGLEVLVPEPAGVCLFGLLGLGLVRCRES